MKIAVVTGASSGMGREMALQLSDHFPFDEIWVIGRRMERLCQLKEQTGTRLRFLSLDLTRELTVKYDDEDNIHFSNILDKYGVS